MVMVAAVYIYIIAIVLRLLDNSAFLLIKHGISVNPFYLKPVIIQSHINELTDEGLIWKLKRNLWFKRLHIVFSILAIATFITGIVYEIYNPYLIHLI